MKIVSTILAAGAVLLLTVATVFALEGKPQPKQKKEEPAAL